MIGVQYVDLKPPGYLFRRHDLRVPAGVTFEALLEPGYWANAAPKLAPDDEVRVVAADGSFDALLTVDQVEAGQGSRNWVQMRALACWRPDRSA